MIYFYKNYNEYSKLATFLSIIGGACYAIGVYVLFLPFLEDSTSQDDPMVGFIICPVFLLIGYGFNAWAKSMALKKQKQKINSANLELSKSDNSSNKVNNDDKIEEIDKPDKSNKVINVSFSNNHLDDDEMDDDDEDYDDSDDDDDEIDDYDEDYDEDDDDLDDDDEEREPIKTVIEVSFPSTNKTSKKSSSKVENKGKEKNSNVKRTSSVIKEIKRKSEK